MDGYHYSAPFALAARGDSANLATRLACLRHDLAGRRFECDDGFLPRSRGEIA